MASAMRRISSVPGALESTLRARSADTRSVVAPAPKTKPIHGVAVVIASPLEVSPREVYPARIWTGPPWRFAAVDLDSVHASRVRASPKAPSFVDVVPLPRPRRGTSIAAGEPHGLHSKHPRPVRRIPARHR